LRRCLFFLFVIPEGNLLLHLSLLVFACHSERRAGVPGQLAGWGGSEESPHLSFAVACSSLTPYPLPLFFLSTPSTPKYFHNRHSTNYLRKKNSWHTSFPPSRIIKVVINNQTDPANQPGLCI